jgi:hypothetical protein
MCNAAKIRAKNSFWNYKLAALPGEPQAQIASAICRLKFEKSGSNAGIALLAIQHLRNALRHLRYLR